METIKGIIDFCANYISTISIWDILDMTIIAFIIYYAISFVRRTNFSNVVKGILILVVALWMSSLMNLSVLNYFLNATFEIGILAIIVLFQPELRRLLEEVGSNRFGGLFKSESDAHAIDYAISQTVSAYTEMSKTKTGALMVFERKTSLDAYIKSGTVINADPATELIMNIFFHNSPLHDGAVIVREGKIISAACMLPLSNNNNLSRDIGMRHRAAVGMSEHSDAVVVVVSEETGALSVAIGGMLKRHLTPATFEKLLRNELMPKEEQTEGAKKFFRKKPKAGDR